MPPDELNPEPGSGEQNPDPIPTPDPIADPTPEASSPSADEPEAGAAEAAQQARAIVPATPEDYALNLSEGLQKVLGDTTDDPMIASVRGYFKDKGYSQGQMDDFFGVVEHLGANGLLQSSFDPAAELAMLGEEGPARRQEVETWASALKDRGDLTDAEFGELMSLAPTAAGVTLIEKIRKMSGIGGDVKAPGGGQGEGGGGMTAAQKAAEAAMVDPRYQSDQQFKAAADKAYMAAYP